MAIKSEKHPNGIIIDMNMKLDDDIVPVQLTIKNFKIEIRVKGQRKRKVSSTWTNIINNMELSHDAPAKYMSRPVTFIKGE